MLPEQILFFSTTVRCLPSFDFVTISLLTGSIEMLPSKCNRRSTPPRPTFRISSNQDLIVNRRPLLRISFNTTLLEGVDAIIARAIARLCISVFSFDVWSLLPFMASANVSYKKIKRMWEWLIVQVLRGRACVVTCRQCCGIDKGLGRQICYRSGSGNHVERTSVTDTRCGLFLATVESSQYRGAEHVI